MQLALRCRRHPTRTIKSMPGPDLPANKCSTCHLLSILSNEYSFNGALEDIEFLPRANARQQAVIKCEKHPRYNAKRRSSCDCQTCNLIYVLRWQYTSEAEKRLGPLNAYFLDGPSIEALGKLYIHV